MLVLIFSQRFLFHNPPNGDVLLYQTYSKKMLFGGGELAVLVTDRCDRARDQLRKIVVQLSKEKNLQKEVDLVNSIQSKILKALNIEMEVDDENAAHKENPDKIVELDSKEEAEILDIEHQLTAMFDTFVPVRRFFVKEYYIPKIKRINATEACKLPKEERISALVDLTANGSCKNCIVFGLKGLYYCNGSFSKTAGPGFIGYKEFCSEKLSSPSNSSELSIGNESIYMENSSIKIGEVIYMLETAQKTLKESFSGSKKEKKSKESMSPKKEKKSKKEKEKEEEVQEYSTPLGAEVNLIDI